MTYFLTSLTRNFRVHSAPPTHVDRRFRALVSIAVLLPLLPEPVVVNLSTDRQLVVRILQAVRSAENEQLLVHDRERVRIRSRSAAHAERRADEHERQRHV